MARIVLDQIEKRYPNGVAAVRALSLDIADGELLVLVGPSGSGKSTVLRMIAGLEQVTSGSIRIGERDVTALPPQERDLAMVFQSYALYPHMTVRENLGFGLSVRNEPRALIAQRVEAAAQSLGIAALLGRKPAQLSGGQRQRVALGRAIVRQPLAFLFDEPLSNLDARLRAETRAELARLHQQLGATMVYVTHDQVEAMTLGTRVAVMHEGVLQQVAPPMELYRKPTNRFVAGFIGSPAMNFLERDGVVIGIRPQQVLIGPEARVHGSTVTGRVWLVEPVGSEQLVHVELPDISDLVAVVSADRAIQTGDQLAVALPAESVHRFDPSIGRRLPT